jgi:hypothetical protein
MRLWFVPALALLLTASCSTENNPVNQCAQAPDIFINEKDPGSAEVAITIRINSGLSSAPPSYALWAKYPDGETESIYATCKASLGYSGSQGSYSESLPVWFGIRSEQGLVPGNPDLDAITTATPTRDNFEIRWEPKISGQQDTLQLFLEANMPNDFNDYFNSGLGTNGQPSLVWYTSFVVLPDTVVVVRPALVIGRSDPKGQTNKLYSDRNGITTALNIISGIDVKRLK